MRGAEQISIREVPGGAVVAVKVVPGSSRDRLAGVLGDRLKVVTAAAAEKGKANQAAARVLGRALGLSGGDVTLFAGQTNPRKEFLVAGLNADQLRHLLARL